MYVFSEWKFVINVAGSELPQLSEERFDQVLRSAPGSIMESFENRGVTKFRTIYQTSLVRYEIKHFVAVV